MEELEVIKTQWKRYFTDENEIKRLSESYGFFVNEFNKNIDKRFYIILLNEHLDELNKNNKKNFHIAAMYKLIKEYEMQ